MVVCELAYCQSVSNLTHPLRYFLDIIGVTTMLCCTWDRIFSQKELPSLLAQKITKSPMLMSGFIIL